MNRTPLIFVGTSDLAGKFRGKAFPVEDLPKRLERGVGWTPTNVQITCFDAIANSPFGALGDLLLIPQAGTEVRLGEDEAAEHFMLGDIVTLEGAPWAFCTRAALRHALARLEAAGGVHLRAAFEHEFQLLNPPARTYEGYSRDGFELQRAFSERLMAEIAAANLTPDSIMKEYGPNQMEVVIGPELGVRAADAAVMVREITRAVARECGDTATFTPIRDPANVGNGVHIHMSFETAAGEPASYDPSGPGGMSALTGSFAAGVLKYLDSILAFTAPSAISYARLTPHRWSAAYNNLGYRDREAALRVCPVTAKDAASIARQFNIEFRAADAAASPHLALAAVVHAGAQGIEEGLAPPDPTEEDLSLLDEKTLLSRGFVRLPETLEAALERLAANDTVCGWFPDGFVPLYVDHKTAELAVVADKTVAEQCAAYEATY